jgi:hypothetical protein
MKTLLKTDVPFSVLRVAIAAAILFLNYFPLFPIEFLTITTAMFILSLVILTWDVYEWSKHRINNETDISQ